MGRVMRTPGRKAAFLALAGLVASCAREDIGAARYGADDCRRVALVDAATGAAVRGAEDLALDLEGGRLFVSAYDRRAVDGLAVPAEAMRGISRRLAEASLADRAEIACIGRERADLVVAGCAILESIIDLWPAARVGVADRGIREGILRTLARQGRDIPVTRREFRK